MVLVKNWQFFYLFNIGKIGEENVSENILARKKVFPDYKSKKLKKLKNWHFSMVLVKNLEFFYLFNIGKIGQENVSENILAREKVFPRYNNKMLKKSRNWDLSKGLVHGFDQKLQIFPSF